MTRVARVVEAQQSATSGAFQPRAIRWKYITAYLEALGLNGDVSDRAIAAKIGCRHEAISRWRRMRPAFREWVASQVERRAGELGSSVVKRCAVLAIRGSAKHAATYLRATVDSMALSAEAVRRL